MNAEDTKYKDRPKILSNIKKIPNSTPNKNNKSITNDYTIKATPNQKKKNSPVSKIPRFAKFLDLRSSHASAPTIF